MADGETHYKYYRAMLIPVVIPIGVVCFLLLFKHKDVINPFLFAAFYGLQYLLAAFIDPDSDLAGLTNSEGRMMRTGKKVSRLFTFFGYLSVAYWFMYAWFISLFGGHRSLISHGIFIGTIIRIFYFNIPIFIILKLLYEFFKRTWGWTGTFAFELYLDVWIFPYFLSQFIVWFMTDAMHLILDTRFAKGKLY